MALFWRFSNLIHVVSEIFKIGVELHSILGNTFALYMDSAAWFVSDCLILFQSLEWDNHQGVMQLNSHTKQSKCVAYNAVLLYTDFQLINNPQFDLWIFFSDTLLPKQMLALIFCDPVPSMISTTKQCCFQMIIFTPKSPPITPTTLLCRGRGRKSMQSQNFSEGLRKLGLKIIVKSNLKLGQLREHFSYIK